MADRVGYRATNYLSRGERVFTNGKTFLTQDTTAHTGRTLEDGKQRSESSRRRSARNL
jgi:hypothetical protein